MSEAYRIWMPKEGNIVFSRYIRILWDKSSDFYYKENNYDTFMK